MKIADIFFQAFNTIKNSKLRTGITVAIIAFGIMALIGIITAITAMNKSLEDSFSTMGANSFTIRFRDFNFGGGSREVKKTSAKNLKRKKSSENKIITFDQARLFKERFRFPARVSLSVNYRNVTVNTAEKKTNPDIMLIGTDENYLLLSGYDLQGGRNFNEMDVQSGSSVCIIGNSVAKTLYGDQVSEALEKTIKVAGLRYRVIGVLKNRGSSSFLNADNIVLTTYNNLRRMFTIGNTSFNIGVRVNDIKLMDAAISEAKGTFRPIRNLQIDEQNNFYITKSDSIAQVLINSLGAITTAAGLIGLITLISAAIGLMNIMLVSVNERTREIGLIKALGGKAAGIRLQFLLESVLISLSGAFFGIVLGIAVGNIVGIFLHTGFVIPWGWVLAGVITCSLVGLGAGSYPAVKAARLDPIVALRYE